MSDELGAVGGAATAGLVAGAIEGREAHVEGAGACANCGAALAGRYCSHCGQAAHVHRSLAHVAEEFLHGILHFDTKAWRTLPLLAFRPGTLTHNYIHGKRARYISPLAIFLFAVFLMFLTFSFVGSNMVINDVTANLSTAPRAELDERMEDLTESIDEIHNERVRLEGSNQPGQSAAVAGLKVSERELIRSRSLVEAEIARREGRAAPEAPAAEADEGESSSFIDIEGDSALEKKIREKLEHPEFLFYKVQQNAYKLSFLLIPISLPFVALLFLWKRGLTLYDHVVFLLYSQAFMSLLFIAMTLAETSVYTAWAGGLLFFAVPVHMFFQLKGTYVLGWWSALWRTLFLLVFALISLIVFVVLMFALGVLG